jgi:hypothetical protein
VERPVPPRAGRSNTPQYSGRCPTAGVVVSRRRLLDRPSVKEDFPPRAHTIHDSPKWARAKRQPALGLRGRRPRRGSCGDADRPLVTQVVEPSDPEE